MAEKNLNCLYVRGGGVDISRFTGECCIYDNECNYILQLDKIMLPQSTARRTKNRGTDPDVEQIYFGYIDASLEFVFRTNIQPLDILERLADRYSHLSFYLISYSPAGNTEQHRRFAR